MDAVRFCDLPAIQNVRFRATLRPVERTGRYAATPAIGRQQCGRLIDPFQLLRFGEIECKFQKTGIRLCSPPCFIPHFPDGFTN